MLPPAHTAHAITSLILQMTSATTPSIPVPSFDKVKMEDRKRSLAPDSDESVPRPKRIKEENGGPRMSAENEAAVEVMQERPSLIVVLKLTLDPIKAYQKDAILRQMKEYKTELKHWQKEYNRLSDKLIHHDDHLRTIDAWFSQLLDEVRILAADVLPTPPTSANSTSGMNTHHSPFAKNIC